MKVEIRKVFKHLETQAGKMTLLDNVNLSVEKGEFIAIMGPSGSGKSTLLFLLGLIDTPTFGHILFEGIEVSEENESMREQLRLHKIGIIFQGFNLLPTLTVLENVMLPMQLAGSFSADRQNRALTLLRVVGIDAKANEKPQNLSGGEQQRVAIARALANRPGLVLADEPTGNLDSRTGMEIMQVIKSISEYQDLTTILVTHDPKVASFADRICHLEGGHLSGGASL